MKRAAKKGLYRVNWNGRLESTAPVNPNADNSGESSDQGPLALPGKYIVHLVKVENGFVDKFADDMPFNLVTLSNSSLPVDKTALNQFNTNLADFRRVVLATVSYCEDVKERVKYIKSGTLQSSVFSYDIIKDVKEIETLLQTMDLAFNGDRSMAKREFETASGLIGDIEGIVDNLWSTTIQQTSTYIEKLNECKVVFKKIYSDAKQLKQKIESLENKLESRKAPYTPGRFPDYSEQ